MTGHRRGVQNRERQQELVRLFVEERLPKSEIALRFGITRERVRQLLFLALGEQSRHGEYFGKYRMTEEEVALCAVGATTVQEVVRCSGVGESTLQKRLPAVRQTVAATRLHARALRWDAQRDLSLQQLRAFYAREGRAPTAIEMGFGAKGAYDKRRPDLPIGSTLSLQFGSLRKAMLAAGITPRTPGKRIHERQRKPRAPRPPKPKTGRPDLLSLGKAAKQLQCTRYAVMVKMIQARRIVENVGGRLFLTLDDVQALTPVDP